MRNKFKKTLGGCLTLAAVASLGVLYHQNSTVPNLGVTDGQFKPLSPKPNCVSTQTRDPGKKVSTMSFRGDASQTMDAIKRACHGVGGAEFLSESQDYLHVVFTTPNLRFKDDAEFWLDQEKEQVHFRAAARAGYSDMGNNKRRYLEIQRIYRAL